MQGKLGIAIFASFAFCCNGCPPWVDEYVHFHAQQRANASAKTLTYAALKPEHGAGFGDRFRAIIWGLRLASATDRVFYVEIAQPFRLELAMSPANIRWTGYATVQQFLLFFPFFHKTSIHVSFGFTVWDNEIIVYIAEPALFGLGHGKASNTRWVLSPTPHCVTGSFWKWTWKGIEHKAGLEPDSTFRNRLFLDVDRRNRQTSMVW